MKLIKLVFMKDDGEEFTLSLEDAKVLYYELYKFFKETPIC